MSTALTSMQPNANFEKERSLGGKLIAALGIISEKKIESKILFSNQSRFPLIFILSSDPSGRQFDSGHFGAGAMGLDVELKMNEKPPINQIFQLKPGRSSEALCRTKHVYVTVARKKSNGKYAVYRYKREVILGSTYTATEDMVEGVDLDVRSENFLEEFD